MTGALTFATLALAILLLWLWQRQLMLRREAFIRTATLPHGLFERLQRRHPGLSLKECQLVAHGLRQFFLAYLKSGRRFVSMPSQVADDLWHEFILFTKHYDAFCRKAFGGFLHHTPAIVLGSARQSNAGLRRCWWHVCVDENINPRAPTRLPLLFALDAKLNVPNGFRYTADCNAARRQGDQSVVYCGGDFSSDSFDGGIDGLGDSGSSDSSDGGSSGDGCGGGGCGGGGD
jgi:hypothetical protein